jgi:glutamine amidotransferase
MCDLFALSAVKSYSAPKSLPLFALRARRNMDGWGIGFFNRYRACVEKSARRVFRDGQVHDSFQRLARVVRSRIIVAHVRFRTSGPIDECHAHPFVLRFRGQDWIFAHNGRAPSIESYRSRGAPLAGVASDSARTFEFLRDAIVQHYQHAAAASSLFSALAQATLQLIDEYPGNYNYLLTNGCVLFAFTNHRHLMLLKGSEILEGGLLLTTVGQGLSDDQWLRVMRPPRAMGTLLAIMGTDTILHENL